MFLQRYMDEEGWSYKCFSSVRDYLPMYLLLVHFSVCTLCFNKNHLKTQALVCLMKNQNSSIASPDLLVLYRFSASLSSQTSEKSHQCTWFSCPHLPFYSILLICFLPKFTKSAFYKDTKEQIVISFIF